LNMFRRYLDASVMQEALQAFEEAREALEEAKESGELEELLQAALDLQEAENRLDKIRIDYYN